MNHIPDTSLQSHSGLTANTALAHALPVKWLELNTSYFKGGTLQNLSGEPIWNVPFCCSSDLYFGLLPDRNVPGEWTDQAIVSWIICTDTRWWNVLHFATPYKMFPLPLTAVFLQQFFFYVFAALCLCLSDSKSCKAKCCNNRGGERRRGNNPRGSHNEVLHTWKTAVREKREENEGEGGEER